MSIIRSIGKTGLIAGLLIALAASSSGCGFLCFNNTQCLTGCCVGNRCVNNCVPWARENTPDATASGDAKDFSDLLQILFTPPEE